MAKKQVLGIYKRVSSEEQLLKGISLDTQEKLGIETAIKYGFSYQVFADGGVSGTVPFAKRPGLNDLVNKINDEKIHAIFITDLDRLSRDNLQSQVLKQIFKENEIRLFDSKGEIDLKDENQELLTDLQSLLASFEIKKTSKRIKRVLLENIKSGKVSGGPIITYGYMKDENKMMVINESEAKVVRMIFKMSLEGMGTRVIADKLNKLKIPTKRGTSLKGYMKVKGERKTDFIWRDSVCYRILTNTAYYGKRLYKDELYDCPAIIDENTFKMIQDKLSTKQNFVNTRNKYTYLLKGVMFCGKCQGRMYGRSREDKSDHSYICTTQRFKGEFCQNRGIGIDYVEQLVIDNLLNLDKFINVFFKRIENRPEERKSSKVLDSYKTRIKECENGINNLLLVASKNASLLNLDEFNKQITELTTKKELLIEREKQLLKNKLVFTHKNEIIKFVNDSIKGYKKSSDKQSFISTLIKIVSVRWIPETLSHRLFISYKIDLLSQYQLSKEIDVNNTGTNKNHQRKIKILSESMLIRNMVEIDGSLDVVYDYKNSIAD